MVEGPHSFYKAEDRVTDDLLNAFEKHYDPKFRFAPVVCGYDPATGACGPAHKTGMYLPSPGRVEAVRRAGKYLEVKLSQRVNEKGKPAIKDLVDQGFVGISIAWMPSSDLPGSPPYLKHVALLSGENPGTPGIPPLSDAFRAIDAWNLSDGLPFVMQPAPTVGADGFFTSTCCRSLADCEASWQPGHPDGDKPAKEDPMAEITPEALSALVERAVGAAIEPRLAAALKPISEGLDQVRTLATEAKATADAAQTTATSADTNARTLAEVAATSSAEGRVRACVQSGRVRPNEYEGEMETVRALPAEAREKHLARLEKRSPLLSERGIPYLDSVEEAGDLREFAGPDGRVRVLPEHAAMDAKIRSHAAYQANPTPETYAKLAFELDGGSN